MSHLLSHPPNKEDSISFDEIVSELNISRATARNWVNTGYLTQLPNSRICIKSYNDFKEKAVGTHKLSKRANKQHLDIHNHDRVSYDIINKIKECSLQPSVHTLSEYYENSLSVSHRNKEGIYYTPHFITEHMLNFVPKEILSQSTFCDPCCGSGNFLMAAVDAGIKPENIYGFDIDENAVAISKARLLERTNYESPNIRHLDFLENFDQINELKRFDLIFTNPPWGKKHSTELKTKYASRFNSKNKIDSSAIFSLACIEILNKDGYLGLLLPEAFFNISAYTSAREKILQHQIISFSDYKKPFDGLQTRAQSVILKKSSAPDEHICQCNFEKSTDKRHQRSFKENPNFIFNFHVSDEESRVLELAHSIPHITLEGKATWALGIVTGNNSKHIKPSPEDGFLPVYKGSDITRDGFKSPSNYIQSDFSLFQQVAPLHLYTAKEKVVYRFINSDLVFACDTKQRYFLNSANFFILNDDAPLSHAQICFILNTKFTNWLFKNTFRTHKILRSDLEKLPIYADFFSSTKTYTEDEFNNYLGVEEINGTFRLKK
ncbi:MAG: N-6 DNA methylase [Pseudobdellovibrionaceae bacterium]|jgi:site-specific DNA-methyltransferase (adenine-specific)|nr:N-6 DNA methylase [Pseudobdellovibrionaceae bacterium]